MTIHQSVRLRHFFRYGYKISLNIWLTYEPLREPAGSYEIMRLTHLGSSLEVPEGDSAMEDIDKALERDWDFTHYLEAEYKTAMEEDKAENLWPVPEEREIQQ